MIDWTNRKIKVELTTLDDDGSFVTFDCIYLSESPEYLVVKENDCIRMYLKSNVLSWGDFVDDVASETTIEVVDDEVLSSMVKKNWVWILLLVISLIILLLFTS